MATCVLCRRVCTPMADYEQPVCVRCDAAHEDYRAARFIPGPRHRLPDWAARLPLSERTGPGDPAEIASLLAAFDSRPGRRAGVS